MQVLKRIVLASLAALAIAAAPDARFVTVPYDEHEQTVFTVAAGLINEFILEPGEKLPDHFASAAPTSSWHLDVEYSGAGAVQTPHLIVKPVYAGESINIVIPTSRRDYHLYLTAADDVPPVYVAFSYAGDARAQAKARSTSSSRPPWYRPPTPAPVIAIATPEPAPTLSPEDLRHCRWVWDVVEYQVHGSPVRPTTVCDDGSHTYVQLPALPALTPVIYVVGPQGDDVIASFSFFERTLRYKIDGVPSRLVFVDGGDRLVIGAKKKTAFEHTLLGGASQ